MYRISSLNEFRYNLPYSEMTGGALAIRTEQLRRVNGFSNVFFGWGGEDDEFHQRLAQHDLQPVRLATAHAQYISLRHNKQSDKSSIDMATIVPANDGLKTLNYSLHSLQLFPDHTLIQVIL